MNNHIILTAFGTTSSAKKTYTHLDSLIKPEFPDCQIHWTYSSPTVRRTLTERDGTSALSLHGLLEKLNQSRNRPKKTVIQSVHVTPGYEFHRMVREAKHAAFPYTIGMPLLTAPTDFHRMADCLTPLLDQSGDQAVLILGHGTSHPSWTTYPALEQVLRKRAGDRIFVAALQKFPDSSRIIDDIVTSGYQQVLVIPFLMVAGMHFKRDIVGDDPMSWESRLARKNITIRLHDQGLGTLPGVAEIFCSHIGRALTAHTDK